jgi:hypothetical protein
LKVLGLKTIMAYVSDPNQKKNFGLKSSAKHFVGAGNRTLPIVVNGRRLRHCNTEA